MIHHQLVNQRLQLTKTKKTPVRMDEDIVRALQVAKYNDAVQVTVSDGEGSSRDIVLAAGLDETNGGIQWNDVSSTTEAVPGLRRHLRTKRWIFPMLNDHRRNELYDEAIRRACAEVASRHSDPASTEIHGLDIGSGTGLLAMMSAKHLKGAWKGQNQQINITSLEMSSPMASAAKLIVDANQLSDEVDVREGHSCEIPPLEPKACLCTSELLESGLLAEGWIPALRDAWERHLDPRAVVVPQRARVFAQVVSGDKLSSYWGPHCELERFPANRRLKLFTSSSGDNFLLGQSAKGGVQVPIHMDEFLHDTQTPIRLLSEPIHVLDFDLSSKDTVPSPEGQSRSTTFTPIASGPAQGVVFWWELDLFGDDLTYTTDPKRGPWQDHWQQCLFVFSKPRDECERLEKGELATLVASHDDTKLSFHVPSGSDARQTKRLRSQEEDSSLISPQRAWQLNDLNRMEIIRDGIRATLDDRGMDTALLDISDFSLCAIMSALLGAKQVTSLETSSSDLPEATARIAQISNSLPLQTEEGNSFQIVRCHPEALTPEILGGSAAGIVVGEPYYEVLEGWHLQEALNYFYTLRALKTRGVVSEDAVSVPAYASVKICAFESFDIGGSYKACNEIFGFQHDVVNDTNDFSQYFFAIPSWQYKLRPMSDCVEVARLDYNACTFVDSLEVKMPLQKTGTCHGVLMWMEYGIPVGREANGQQTWKVISTRDTRHHQAIQMVPAPAKVSQADAAVGKTKVVCTAVLGRRDGNQDDQCFKVHVEWSDSG